MKCFLIAGEASGDALGAGVMAGLRALAPDVAFCGIGGSRMQAEGLESLFPMDELSVMGLAEVLPRYRQLSRRLRETAAAVVAEAPDVLLTIDSPDFCLRVARRVRAAAPIRTVHYVAPTVWAWRPGRAAKMAGVVDQVLALFPFEPPYMQAHGMRCDFVGHPAAHAPRASAAEAAAFRAAHGIAADAPLLLALPGSRKGEVARLSPIFGAALAAPAAARPDLRVVVPAAPAVAGEVARAAADWPGAPVVLDPRGSGDTEATKRAAFRAADAALAASGTVSLELAAAGTPMVVAYDMAWLSRVLVARLLRVETVTLVNLVSGTRAVPEFLGAACRPGPVGAALTDLLQDASARAAQAEAAAATMTALGAGGAPPGLRAARAVLDGLDAQEG